MEVVNLPQAANIAQLVAGIVALSLALKAALGPVVMYLAEQIKSAYPVRDGAGGLIALGVSLMMGGLLGLMAGALYRTPTESLLLYVALGIFAGFFISAGATESYKASALINVDKSAAVAEVKAADEADKALSDKQAREKALAEAAARLREGEIARGMAAVTEAGSANAPASATVAVGGQGEPPRLGKAFSEAA